MLIWELCSKVSSQMSTQLLRVLVPTTRIGLECLIFAGTMASNDRVDRAHAAPSRGTVAVVDTQPISTAYRVKERVGWIAIRSPSQVTMVLRSAEFVEMLYPYEL